MPVFSTSRWRRRPKHHWLPPTLAGRPVEPISGVGVTRGQPLPVNRVIVVRRQRVVPGQSAPIVPVTPQTSGFGLSRTQSLPPTDRLIVGRRRRVALGQLPPTITTLAATASVAATGRVSNKGQAAVAATGVIVSDGAVPGQIAPMVQVTWFGLSRTQRLPLSDQLIVGRRRRVTVGQLAPVPQTISAAVTAGRTRQPPVADRLVVSRRRRVVAAQIITPGATAAATAAVTAIGRVSHKGQAAVAAAGAIISDGTARMQERVAVVAASSVTAAAIVVSGPGTVEPPVGGGSLPPELLAARRSVPSFVAETTRTIGLGAYRTDKALPRCARISEIYTPGETFDYFVDDNGGRAEFGQGLLNNDGTISRVLAYWTTAGGVSGNFINWPRGKRIIRCYPLGGGGGTTAGSSTECKISGFWSGTVGSLQKIERYLFVGPALLRDGMPDSLATCDTPNTGDVVGNEFVDEVGDSFVDEIGNPYLDGITGLGGDAGVSAFVDEVGNTFVDETGNVFIDLTIGGPSDFDLRKNGISIGSMHFGPGQRFADFHLLSSTSFVAGDVFEIVAPAFVSTIADLIWTISLSQ